MFVAHVDPIPCGKMKIRMLPDQKCVQFVVYQLHFSIVIKKEKKLPASLHKRSAQQMLTLELTFAVLLWRR